MRARLSQIMAGERDCVRSNYGPSQKKSESHVHSCCVFFRAMDNNMISISPTFLDYNKSDCVQ